MALQNYIEKLAAQNDSDVIYSKQPEVVTKIVPPDNKAVSKINLDDHVKVISPDNNSITLKFTNLRVVKKQETKPAETTKQPSKFNFKFNTKKKEEPAAAEKPKKIETENELIERLFSESLTKPQFKQLWIEKFKTAKAGKSLGKENVYAEKIKKGEFQIDEVGGVPRIFMLPDYETRNKDVEQILSEKWL